MKIEWRPMESAPRGGIVMLRTDDGVTAGYWCGADVGWKVIGPQLGGFCVLDCLITGWHPLPDAEGRFEGVAEREFVLPEYDRATHEPSEQGDITVMTLAAALENLTAAVHAMAEERCAR